MAKFRVSTQVEMTRQYIVDAADKDQAASVWEAPPRSEWDDNEKVTDVTEMPEDYDDGPEPFEMNIPMVLRPIEEAPKDRNILAFMWGAWRTARWDDGLSYKTPRPFWSAKDLRVTSSREHQPLWWIDMPPDPPATAPAKVLQDESAET